MTDVQNMEVMKFHHNQMHRMLETTNSSKRKSTATDDVRVYEQCIFSALAPSPQSSASSSKVPTLDSRARLFPNIPKSTVAKGMLRGQKHRKLIRENSNTKFAAIIKRLGRKKYHLPSN